LQERKFIFPFKPMFGPCFHKKKKCQTRCQFLKSTSTWYKQMPKETISSQSWWVHHQPGDFN